MSAAAVMRQASSRPADAGRPAREREIRRLALTNQTVAAALGLHDNNGVDYVTTLECLVLELLASPPVADREDDADRMAHEGGAA